MNRLISLLCLLLLLALAGCATTTGSDGPLLQEQVVDGLTIGLEGTASPQLNASEELIVVLTDDQGQPVDGADVYIDLIMPAMPMGINRPIAEPQGNGRYRAGTAYTMVGAWELTVVATVDGVERRATFAITAVE